MVDTHVFHDKEISDFIDVCTIEKLTDKDLLIRFKEDITVQNHSTCTNEVRRKLRDFLDKNSAEFGKCSSESIKTKLTNLLQPGRSFDRSGSSSTQNSSHAHSVLNNMGKRDILKSPRHPESLFSGPYDGVILSSVKRRFLQDCVAFDVPDSLQLSVLHIMF